MAVNIPIRLVRKGGDLIPLDVTTLTLDVDRGVNPHTTPLGGGRRWAFDMNMAKAVILLEGVITDDDLTSKDVGRGAVASLDFESALNPTLAGFYLNLITELTDLAADMTNDSFDHADTPKLTLIATDGTGYDIHFIKSSSHAYKYDMGGSEKYHVAIHDNSNMNTAVEIATNLRDLLNSSEGPTSNALSSRFTATLATGVLGDNTKVVITQDTVGKSGATNTPSWGVTQNRYTPLTKEFRDGKDSGGMFTSMSAGDKVMSLYGTLNNSNDGGMSFTRTRNAIGAKPATVRQKYADYIIGIQIPFNSTIGNTGGDKYVAKNFFMPTGGTKKAADKHPDQAELASAEIEETNDSQDYSFIKGAVTKATFVQIGGEPIYQFNIQFIPVDSIL